MLKRIISIASLNIFCFFATNNATAVDLSAGSPNFNANINISGKIIKSLECDLSVANPFLEYSVDQNLVPDYLFYSTSIRATNWLDKRFLPNYVASEREFKFTFRCNGPSSSYRIKIDPNTVKFPDDPSGNYTDLFLPLNATTEPGTKVGFILFEERSTERISTARVKQGGSLPIPSFLPAECSSSNAPVGQLGYCTMNFKISANLVGADTTNQFYGSYYVPYYWVTENSYSLNLTVSVEFN